MAFVYDTLKLYTSPDKYYIEPVDSSQVNNEVLIIDRITAEISLQKNVGQIPANAEVKLIYGIIGTIRLLAGPYLLVITQRDRVCDISSQPIWKVTGTQMLPYHKSTTHLTESQVQDHLRYVSMIEYVLGIRTFYYSPTFDLTHTTQRLQNTSPDFPHIPLHERAEQQFVWNGHLLRELGQQSALSRYCLPLMLGYIEASQCTVNGKKFAYIVVTRRSCYRAGVRYFMRGLDTDGHAANYVETEQLIECDGARSSFVQTRGSVPLYWTQYPNLKYKPEPILSSTQDHLDGFQQHFDAQIYQYGKQVLINLLDHKGAENDLVNGYANAVQKANNPNIRYEAFDFHAECKKMNWQRLNVLIERVAADQDKFGYFMITREGIVVSRQEGVFRTNCIDCLDRTNVVQSMLARRSLHSQLVRFGILNASDSIESHPQFDYMLKNLWANNADACAQQYAGTGALKTDFTRTGKRTTAGLVRDGVNSAVRYILNNFYDGFRQDSIDLFLGNFIVEAAEISPFKRDRDWKFFALPVILLVAFSMCLISLLLPGELSSEQILYALFWAASSLITLLTMYFYGSEFVDRPKLVQGKSKMD